VIFYAHACKPAGLKAITYAAIAAAAIDLAFAVIDLGGYWTGAGDLLAFPAQRPATGCSTML